MTCECFCVDLLIREETMFTKQLGKVRRNSLVLTLNLTSKGPLEMERVCLHHSGQLDGLQTRSHVDNVLGIYQIRKGRTGEGDTEGFDARLAQGAHNSPRKSGMTPLNRVNHKGAI